jgi:NADH-quinone oxidoreductase subunit N
MFNTELDALIPMLCITLTALATMGTEAFRGRSERLPIGWWGLIGLGGAALSAGLLWNRNTVGFGVIVADNFGLFVTFVLIVVGALTIMFSSQVVYRDGIPAGEYYALVLFSIVGMIMMATATDLLVIFVALEILSLAVYVLTGIRREMAKGTEAAFKYFLLGAFSSAFFLYGIAFTYGVAGSTRLEAVGSFLSAQALSDNPLILLAVGLLLVGSRSRFPPCRSTCGRRMRTRARQPSSLGSCPPASRSPRLPRSRACSFPRSSRSAPTGRRSSPGWRRRR